MIKVSLADLELAVAYLRKHTTAHAVHIKAEDICLLVSTVDSSGQAVELQLFDADRSQSKAKVMQTTGLETALKAK